MTDSNPQQTSMERLIAQDAEITETSLKENRMRLENELSKLDRNADRSRRLTIRAVVAVVICYIYGMTLGGVTNWLGDYGEMMAMAWVIITWLALIAAGVALTRYWTIHRPLLEKGRTDLQIALFNELKREIAELRKGAGKAE